VKIRIAGPAQADLDYIETWWRAHRDKAPARFEEELEKAKELLRHTPRFGIVHAEQDGHIIRRIVLKKTKVKLFYWVEEDAGVVHIIAAWGGKRGSDPKL